MKNRGDVMLKDNEMLNFKILSVHCLSWKSLDTYIPPKKSYAISLREIGSAVFTLGDSELRAKDGDVILFPRGVGYKVKSGEEMIYTVSFEPCDEETEEALRDLTLPTPIKENKNEYISELFYRLYRVWTLKERGYYLAASSIFCKILGILYKERCEENDSAPPKLRCALEYINSNLASPTLSVRDTAKEIGVSEVYLRRIFNSSLGLSPKEYIMKSRIDMAKELIEGGFYSVFECAVLCGFPDPKYFATAFKRLTGISPSRYKEENKA